MGAGTANGCPGPGLVGRRVEREALNGLLGEVRGGSDASSRSMPTSRARRSSRRSRMRARPPDLTMAWTYSPIDKSLVGAGE
jgi:hypothetical protein